MIEQTISYLMVKSSLLYVIRNRSYSHLKICSRRGTLSILGIEQTEETKHIENKSLNAEFQRYILFFILVLWLALWLVVYQLNHNNSPIQYSGRLLHWSYRFNYVWQTGQSRRSQPWPGLGKKLGKLQGAQDRRTEKTKRGNSHE